jgi:hypothetical protein
MDQQKLQHTEHTPEGLAPKRWDFFTNLERARPVRLATPYLEVETRSIPSMERMIVRELAETTLGAERTRRKGANQLSRA